MLVNEEGEWGREGAIVQAEQISVYKQPVLLNSKEWGHARKEKKPKSFHWSWLSGQRRHLKRFKMKAKYPFSCPLVMNTISVGAQFQLAELV